MKTKITAAALAAVPAGVIAGWLALTTAREPNPAIAAALALLVGWSYIASGLLAWRHQPANRLGPLMVFIGFAWFATYLSDANNSVAFTAGTALESVYWVGFVFLTLSFPTGQLRTRLERGLLLSAVVLVSAVELAWLLLANSRSVICSDCPANALEVTRQDTLATAILDGQRLVGLSLSIFTAVLLVRRWRRASAPHRRSVAPVLWSGSATFLALGASALNAVLGYPLGVWPEWVLACVFASLPLAVLTVLLRYRLARAAVAGLVVELGERRSDVDLPDALRRALGDPTLEVVYWLPAKNRYVDLEGLPVELPRSDSERVSTVVKREGEPVAALLHDPALNQNRDLVDSVCAAAALTLENERLHAELRARLGELQASRARLVGATEKERRRIERDLHDGTQQRLVSIAMALGLAESKLGKDAVGVASVLREARSALALALEELRELSQGIHPAVLVERGLAAALDDLSRRAALPVRQNVTVAQRLPEQLEAAGYFVASEAFANAAKHSHANEIQLTCHRDGGLLVVEVADDGIGGAAVGAGSGLRGLADRVEALGGRLTLSSPPGRGTLLRAEIPCE